MTTVSKLQSILSDAGYEVRSYSGRGMYGKACLGVDLDRGQGLGQLVAAVIAEVEDDDREDVAMAFNGMATDSMGLGQIVYFPDVPYAADPDEHAPVCAECGDDLEDVDAEEAREAAKNGDELCCCRCTARAERDAKAVAS